MAKDIKEVLGNFQNNIEWSIDAHKLSGVTIDTKKTSVANKEALADIKRIIEEAKVKKQYSGDEYANGWDDAIDQYHNNLLKALEG